MGCAEEADILLQRATFREAGDPVFGAWIANARVSRMPARRTCPVALDNDAGALTGFERQRRMDQS